MSHEEIQAKTKEVFSAFDRMSVIMIKVVLSEIETLSRTSPVFAVDVSG
jgi:hypothetical protein